MDAELDRFKSEISLIDYAQAEFGYEVINRESSAASKVLKCGDDKIIVTRQQDGHDVYFSVGDDRDCGSIVDFVQKRKPVNLGQVRKELRQWLPGSKRPAPKRPQRAPDRPRATTKDRADVMRRWAGMSPYAGSYLSRERGINPRIIQSFGVRQDSHGNACIPHVDGQGVMGWESKNAGFTGFATGGQRGVSLTRLDDSPISRIVVTEAGIDAMSYAQMNHHPGTVYISTSGTKLSPEQREQLQRIIERERVPVVLAMDKDEAGDAMAQEVAKMAPGGVKTVRDVPTQGKDWNDALRAAKEAESERAEQRKPKATTAREAPPAPV